MFSLFNGCKGKGTREKPQEKPQEDEQLTSQPDPGLNPLLPNRNYIHQSPDPENPDCKEWYAEDGCNICSRYGGYCTSMACGLSLIKMDCKPESKEEEEKYIKYKEKSGKCVEGSQENNLQFTNDQYPNCEKWYAEDGCNICSRKDDSYMCTSMACGLSLIKMDCKPESKEEEEKYKIYKEKAGKCVE